MNDKISLLFRKISDRGWKWWTPRLIAAAVGLILLIAGILKSTEMDLFIRQIRGYGIISHHMLLVAIAWGLIVAECVLGTALVIGFLPKIGIPVSACLFLIFICATAWAWLTGVTEDCGCFGSWISRTPGEALLEDLVLLAALFAAWLGLKPFPEPPARLGSFTILAAFLIGLLLPLTFGIPLSPINLSLPDRMNIGQELSEVRGLKPIDLRSGKYLVVLIETDCLHCRESVEELNFLAEEKEIPELVAICPNDNEQLMRFLDQFQPIFPVGQITLKTFQRLLGDGDIPRTILMKDQGVLKVWDHEIPEIVDIIEALNPIK